MQSPSRILSIVGFSVLSGLFGLGVTWLVAFLFVGNNNARPVKIMPVLLAGGGVGFIIGLIVSLRVTNAGPKNEKAIIDKYVGGSGRLQIYSGAPIFIALLAALLFGEKLMHKLGSTTGIYVGLGFFLALIAASLFAYDRIPEKLVVPIGIAGWLLTVLLAVWFTLFVRGFRTRHF